MALPTYEERMKIIRGIIDPWVKVGTTTIDGTIKQVFSHVVGPEAGAVVSAEDAAWGIEEFVRNGEPWPIGGRWLRGAGSHINMHSGTAILRCDIVRRQSEIDAERRAQIDFAAKWSVDPWRHPLGMATVKKSPCPECGPHGNRGRVALAFSEVACTTCAGGVPGDAFGVVEAKDGAPSGFCYPTLADLRACLSDAPEPMSAACWRSFAKDAVYRC